MGLDIYVGTLSRYYAGDWETIIQQMGREQGLATHIVHTNEVRNALTDQDKIRETVLAWQKKLSRALQRVVSTPLEWNETIKAPYFTDKPGWDGYTSLLLWAAYAEHPELFIPTFMPDDSSQDPAYKASLTKGFQSSYSQLINGAELWLPCDFVDILPVVDLTGNIIIVGSTKTLLVQLNALNKATWNATRSTLGDWQQAGAGRGEPLENLARFSFSIFHWLTELSIANRLPMKLDY